MILPRSSRLSGFYKKNLQERRQALCQAGWIDLDDLSALSGDLGLSPSQADHMIENALGIFGLPIGVALNFLINGRDVIIPMVIEEPSVIAGASFMAKLVRAGGGFQASASPPEMIGQMQVLDLPNLAEAKQKILAEKHALLDEATQIDPLLKKLGGGARDIEVRIIDQSPIGAFLVVHLIYDVRDAMGANAVNTAVEHLAPSIEAITGGRVHLRILSNLTDRRITRSKCIIPLDQLAFDTYSGEEVRDGIIAAWAFAEADPYRAATHNKGIMNGVDAVVIATGNDWRAIEAGAHAYAARNGKYTSLSMWQCDQDGNLCGSLEMPMAVGIIGGATKVHPAAKAALNLLGVSSANELAQIIVSFALAQNLAALRALATEGIQKGHMSLHARQVAIAAGATGDDVERLARQLVKENNVRI
ncbi:MAG: hydroxymethylglutaryl-CoA reductase, degradative, partial [Anaerolineaceae bacterium]